MKNTNIFHTFMVTFYLFEYSNDFISFGGKLNLKGGFFMTSLKNLIFPVSFQLKVKVPINVEIIISNRSVYGYHLSYPNTFYDRLSISLFQLTIFSAFPCFHKPSCPIFTNSSLKMLMFWQVLPQLLLKHCP